MNNVWVKLHGYITAGGDPVYGCPCCGKGEHVFGIEHLDGYTHKCPDCGAKLIYPWEEKED